LKAKLFFRAYTLHCDFVAKVFCEWISQDVPLLQRKNHLLFFMIVCIWGMGKKWESKNWITRKKGAQCRQ